MFRKNLFYLVQIKGMLTHGFYQKSYAQFGEDLFLRAFFKNKKGFFVDVGAFHPKHYSNTYALYRSGWRGLNVEPNKASCTLFSLMRPRDITVNKGVGAQKGEQTYYVFDHQSCNTFSEAHKQEMLKRAFIHLIDTRRVYCAPLQQIIDEHGTGDQIDLLNIDVEGMGLTVLETLDFTQQVPRVICVEDELFSPGAQQRSPIHSFLHERGYSLRAWMGPTCIYVYEKGE